MCKIGFGTIRKKKYEQFKNKERNYSLKSKRSRIVFHLKRNR